MLSNICITVLSCNSINAYCLSVQVPGVEADDVIGTLAVKSVASGMKVFFLPFEIVFCNLFF